MALIPESQSFDHFRWADVVTLLRRGWPTALLVALAVTAGTYGYLMYLTNQYEANARLLVKLGRENAEVPLTVEKGGLYTTGVQKEEINSYIRLMSSRVLVADTVDAVGVERFDFRAPPPETLFGAIKYAVKQVARGAKELAIDALVLVGLKTELSERDKIIKTVQRFLDVSHERDSHVISVSLRLPDPQLAQDTIATLIDLYIERHIDLRKNADVGRVFEAQSNTYRQELAALQDRITALKVERGLSSAAEQRAAMVGRLSELEISQDTMQRRLRQLDREADAVDAQLRGMAATSVAAEDFLPNPSRQRVEERLIELRIERADLINRYSADAEPIAVIDAEIRELERLRGQQPERLSAETTVMPDDQYARLQIRRRENAIERAGLAAALEENAALIEQIRDELDHLAEGEAQLAMLEVERKVMEQKFFTNVTRREEARINEALDLQRVANVAVLTPPTVSPEPVAPKRLFIMGIGVFAGLVAGAGLALVREWISDVVHGPEDLDGLDWIEVLGEFPLGRSLAVTSEREGQLALPS